MQFVAGVRINGAKRLSGTAILQTKGLFPAQMEAGISWNTHVASKPDTSLKVVAIMLILSYGCVTQR